MTIFLYNEGGPLYSVDAISRLAELEIMKKRASTEAYQAQREDVQFRVWSFFNCPSPLGIFQVPRRKLIDVDEFGITMEKCNRTGGVLGCVKMGTTILVPRSRSSLQSNRGIQGFRRMSVGVFSVLGIGFGVSRAVGQQPTFSKIFATTFARR